MWNLEDDKKGSPFFIGLFWIIVGGGLLLAFAAMVGGGYAH